MCFVCSFSFLFSFHLFLLQQPLQWAVPAAEIDGEVGAMRKKRRNAGVNRRYSDEEYVVDEVEEEGGKRNKRRRTSGTSEDVKAHVAAWMAQAPNGPVSDHLIDAAESCMDFNFTEVQTLEALMELENQSSLTNRTMGAALARLADVAVANGDCLSEVDGLASAMEMD
jgi:hypothetical protein